MTRSGNRMIKSGDGAGRSEAHCDSRGERQFASNWRVLVGK